MFRSNDIVVLDINSKFITAIIASPKSSEVCGIKASVKKKYSGFRDGVYFDEKEVKQTALEALKHVLSKQKVKRRTLYVSVPSEFATVVARGVSTEFEHIKKIENTDVNALLDKADIYQKENEFIPINVSAVYFECDKNGKKLLDPTGESAGSLVALSSCVLCSNKHISLFNSVAKEAGFSHCEFISSALAQCIYLFEAEERMRELLLIDLGYLSSSVSVVQGGGIKALKSFSYGSAYIAAEIYSAFNISFDSALELLEKVDLNLVYGIDDYCLTESGDKIALAEVSEVVKSGLDTLVTTLKEAIVLCEYRHLPELPFFLTGEGITSIRGAIKYIEHGLIKAIEVVAPKLPPYNKPTESSAISLLNAAMHCSGKKIGRMLRF